MMMMKSRRSHSVTLISFCSVWRRRKSMVMSLQQTNLQLELKAADRGGGTTPPQPHNAAFPQCTGLHLFTLTRKLCSLFVRRYIQLFSTLPTMHCFPSSQLTNSWSVMSWGNLRGGENLLKTLSSLLLMFVYVMHFFILFIFYYLIIFTRELMI